MTTYTALDNDLPTVTASDLITSGTPQIVVICPHCNASTVTSACAACPAAATT
ncbi:hypothetical protein ACIHFE_34325 [Streptomyces sp. NPDC052396]|uniref:hypothetical protein n=1 Tax=Streptomyces sp. NPDC052396 TaxID=3365689 RepID=UPI0037D14DDA